MGRVGLGGSAFRGGVHSWVLDTMPPVVGDSVGRVLFSLCIWSILSEPRYLLSVLDLGMSVLDHVVDPPVLSFLCCVFACPLVFGFVISLGRFTPVGSASVGGHRWWTSVVEDVC